ncbi:bactofilin family protein [Cesiribacter andamanensis]|uniref:Polymer-forming cytoskeletal n=1 Tax=Cesiribacter andamanensis AMV16 TaxID=1279009 RepID=M7N3N7_9BACT|nr:polymer-forming cytoskeletal protein [Cesiribacter andamanensis]EMR01821.1 Polymer-forming cytoskeletal [Cesiribacter andamanensis AMV16]
MFNNNKQVKKVTEEQLTSATNTIGNGTSIVGDVETFGNIRIDGKVKGNVTTKSKLVLGDTSYIEGDVLAQNAEIYGEVHGRVEVTELLILKPTAKIYGTILSGKLVTDQGASLNVTQMHVGDEAKAKEIKINTGMNGAAKEGIEPIQQVAKAKSA